MNNNIDIAVILALAGFFVMVANAQSSNQTAIGNSTAYNLTSSNYSATIAKLTMPEPTMSFNSSTGTIYIVDVGASGGVPPYHYQWVYNFSVSSLNSTLHNATTALCGAPNSQTCAFPIANQSIGNYSFYLVATDNASPKANSVVDPMVTIEDVTVSPSSPITLNVGQSQTITATVSYENSDEQDDESYIYTWSVGSGTCPGFSNPGNVASFVYTPNEATSNCVFKVTIVDSSSDRAGTATSGTITVNPVTLSVAQAQSSANPIDKSQQITITAMASGGTAPYSGQLFVAYNSSSNPFTLSGTCTANGTSISCPYINNAYNRGAFVFKVVVSDSASHITNSTPSQPVVIENLTLNPHSASLGVGQSVTFTNSTTPGDDKYAGNYVYSVNPISGLVRSGNTFTCDFAGNYIVTLTSHNNFGQDSNPPGNETVEDSAAVSCSSSFGNSNVIVSIPSPVIVVGQNEIIAANVQGGNSPFSYSWTVNGNGVESNSPTFKFFGNSTTISHSPDLVQVTVTDKFGQTGTATGTVTVNTAVSLGLPQIIIPNSIIDAGQTENVTANVLGGVAPFTYAWTENGHQISQTTQSISFTGTVVGVNTLLVTVTDHTGAAAAGSGAVTVNSKLSSGSPSVAVTSSNIDVGQNDIITANAFGGTAPYTYSWMENGNTIIEGNTFTFTPSAAGTYTFNVTVTDAAGQQTTGSVIVTVYATITFGAPSLALKYASIDIGQSETVSANAMEGRSPYTYAWTVGGKSVPGTTNSIIFTGTAVGTNTIGVIATDSNLEAVSANAVVTVNAALTIGSPSVTVTSSEVDVGQNDVITANALGGTAPYTYAWTQNGVPVAGSKNLTFTPATAGKYIFNVTVTDSAGETVKGTVTVNVNNKLNTTQPITQYNTTIAYIDQNQSVTLTENTPTNGTSPYTYNWIEILPNTSNTVPALGCANPRSPICVFSTNAFTTTGTYKFYVIINDSVGDSTTVGPVTVEVYLALNVTPPAIDPIDQGQTAYISDVMPSGGVGPYSYNILVETPGSNTFVVANSICPTTSSGSGQSAGTDEICAFNSNSTTKTGIYRFKFQVTDSASTPQTVTSSANLLLVNVTPTATLIPSNAVLTTGQSETLTATLVSGVGPFNVIFTYQNGTVANTVTEVSYNGMAAYTFAAGGAGTITFNVVVIDDGTTTPFVFNSTELPIVINAVVPPTTTVSSGGGGGGGGGGSSGGGGGSSGGGGGGGGSFKPTVLQKAYSSGLYCVDISNFTHYETQKVDVVNTSFSVLENYITPTTAGVSVNGTIYELTLRTPQYLGTYHGRNYSIELLNLSYLPIIDTITVSLCGSAPAPSGPAYTQINITTNKSSYTGSFNLSQYVTLNLHVNGLGLSAKITSNSSTGDERKVNVTKYIGGPAVAGYDELTGFNITIMPSTYTTAHVVLLGYQCGNGTSGIEILQLKNGAWVPATGYSLDAVTCQISLTTHGAQTTIGVFKKAVQPATTVQAEPATPAPSSSTSPLVFIIIALILIMLLLSKRRKRKPDEAAVAGERRAF